MALEGPVFRFVSGLERLVHGPVDAEMIRSGYICAFPTHIRRPLMTFVTSLSSFVVTLGLGGAQKGALEGLF